jgi:large subunit ribosomal protein L25
MDKLVLKLDSRSETGRKNRQLRQSGKMPAVVYGRGEKSQSVSVEARVFEKIYDEAGGNKIIGLKIDDDRQKNALIHDVQTDSRTGHQLHADFYLVRMDEKIKTEVPLHFTGESTAVYQQEGTLMRPLETIEVEALPSELPENFEVDISILDDFSKTITVGDLKVSGNVEVLTPTEELVAKVEPPRSEEELAELEEAPEEELPEGVAEEGAEAEGEEGEKGESKPDEGEAKSE